MDGRTELNELSDDVISALRLAGVSFAVVEFDTDVMSTTVAERTPLFYDHARFELDVIDVVNDVVVVDVDIADEVHDEDTVADADHPYSSLPYYRGIGVGGRCLDESGLTLLDHPYTSLPYVTGNGTGWRWMKRASLAAACVLIVAGPRVLVQPVTVSADSMRPTFSDGDYLLLDKVSYRLRDPGRGEVVVTRNPQTGQPIVKRVVAVGGDSVGIENGLLVLNGSVIIEDYTDQREMEGYFYGPIEVPDGYVFLLGDNRLESVDSRRFGPVPVNTVDGRVITRIWPR